jgi:hypothetical protein
MTNDFKTELENGAYDIIEHEGALIAIYADEDAENPRVWDNQGTFWTYSNRHNSPDEGADDIDEAEKLLTNPDFIALPVFHYSHGGTAYAAAQANPFSCPWDSGRAGLIFVAKADIRKEYGIKRITAKVRHMIEQNLKNEVTIYSDWADGDVFRFVKYDAETGEELDSCTGFYGNNFYENGLLDTAAAMEGGAA